LSSCPLALPGGCHARILPYKGSDQFATGQGDWYTYDDAGSIPDRTTGMKIIVKNTRWIGFMREEGKNHSKGKGNSSSLTMFRNAFYFFLQNKRKKEAKKENYRVEWLLNCLFGLKRSLSTYYFTVKE
jgi:hypothetical protein